jgi:hypothetical protein
MVTAQAAPLLVSLELSRNVAFISRSLGGDNIV